MNIPNSFKCKTSLGLVEFNAKVVGDNVHVMEGKYLVDKMTIDKFKEKLRNGWTITDEPLNKAEHLKEVKREFNHAADDQELKGLTKYGQPLDPLDNYDWLNMATQEQVDGFKYLVAEKKKREHAIKKIREILDWLEGGNE